MNQSAILNQSRTSEGSSTTTAASSHRDQRQTICHVIHSLGIGGAEVLLDLMVRTMSDEFRFVVAVLDEIGEIGERLQKDGFTIEHLHRSPGIDYRCARRLRAFADRESAAILHAHQYTPFFQSMLSRGFAGQRPVVFTEHGRHCPDLPSRKRMLVNRLLLKKRDRLIGVGQSVARALINNEGLPESRVEVIYNGVDLNRSLPEDSPLPKDSGLQAFVRSEFGFSMSDFVAIQVARLHELKDHETAIRTMAIVCREVPHARLLLVGEGECRPQIERLIHELNLEHHVVLAGSRNDVPELLNAADMFLMTSISEGIPLTLIEAMAAGIPIVSTSVGGIPEMIEHEVNGYLHEPRDAEGLASSMILLARDFEERYRVANNGQKTAVAQFSLETMIDQYRQVYREVLGVRS